MNRQTAHAFEDKLLEFAYGELSAEDARAVETHVKDCTRCADELAAIGGVRTAYAELPQEPAPEAGLDSLLAYAHQQARRNAAGPEPKRRWRTWLFALSGVSAILVVGGISHVAMKLTGRSAEALGGASVTAEPMRTRSADKAEAKKLANFGDGYEGEAPSEELAAAPAPVPSRLAPPQEQPAAPVAKAERQLDEKLGAAGSKVLGSDGFERKSKKARLELGKRSAPLDLEGSGGGIASAGPSSKGDAYLPPRKDAAPKAAPVEAAPPVAESEEQAFDDAIAAADEDAMLAREQEQRRKSAKEEERARPPQAIAQNAPAPPPPVTRTTDGRNAMSEPAGVARAPATASAKPEPQRASPGRLAGAPAAAPERAPAEPGDSVSADRNEELQVLRSALVRARGEEAARLLWRICELELESGKVRQGRATCARLVAEHPDSGEAELGRRALGIVPAPRSTTKAAEPAPSEPAR